MKEKLTPEDIIYAYQMGYFPMAESRDGEIYWHSPDPRAIIPIENIKPPRSIKKTLKTKNFDFRIDTEFEKVMKLCANREETWISTEMIELYTRLNAMGIAHSVETWENNKLVGGLYGITLGAAFFGESMFTRIPDASKAAFYVLVERLKKRRYILLDSQYINTHTQSLGAIEISKELYMVTLKKALRIPSNFID